MLVMMLQIIIMTKEDISRKIQMYRLYTVDGLSIVSIAKQFGISRQRVHVCIEDVQKELLTNNKILDNI